MAELLPCPFCGGEANLEFETIVENDKNVDYFFVKCKKCQAQGGECNIPHYAVQNWNTRCN